MEAMKRLPHGLNVHELLREFGIRILPIADFESQWHDTHAGEKTERWMMAVTNFKG